MKRVLLAGFFAITALFASTYSDTGLQAASSGCIEYRQVQGSHNWKFFNHCGTRIEVAYCVRYAFGTPQMYVGQFQFNNSLTVVLVNVPNTIHFNYCAAGQCRPPTPHC
jgi:hypothetical protein